VDVWRRIWSNAVDDAGLPFRYTPYQVLHTHASWLIAAGQPLPYIQARLGHEKITTTVDTYGHLARSDFDPLLHLGAGLTRPAQIGA